MNYLLLFSFKSMNFNSNINEVSDPSDWDNCKLPSLSNLDSFLRCQICKDFLNAPVLTSCGHVFCSICIRRTISNSNKCPLCLEETYESSLRKVLILDNIVKWFNNNRNDLLKNLSIDLVNDSQNDSSSDISVISELNGNGNVNVNGNEGKKEKEEVQDNLVECPICGVFMTPDEIQGKHIDQCLKNPNGSTNRNTKRTTSRSFFKNSSSSDESTTPKNTKKRQINIQLQPNSIKRKHRIPNLDTSISTNKLKEKLNYYKLPINGKRNELEQRMKEFINLYNANLDSINPVSDISLISKLKKWESLINNNIQTQNNNNIHSDTNSNNSSANSSPPITFDKETIKRHQNEHKSWNKKNKNHYEDLIKIARMNMQKQKSKQLINNEDNNNNKHHIDDDELSDIDTELIT